MHHPTQKLSKQLAGPDRELLLSSHYVLRALTARLSVPCQSDLYFLGTSLLADAFLQALFQPYPPTSFFNPKSTLIPKTPIAMAQAPPPAFSDIAKSANDVCARLGQGLKAVALT